MLKLIIGILFMAGTIASADNGAVPLSLKNKVPLSNDSVIMIMSPRNLSSASFRKGELLVDFVSRGRITTYHDSTFRILAEKNDSSAVIINLYEMARWYFSEASAITGVTFNQEVGPANAAFILGNGTNWRIQPKNPKR
jgi:hypothetical protein